MIAEPLIFVGTSDLAGKTRGKAFPASHLPKRLGRGVGWTPTNVQITCFDTIADSPFGALGDLLLVPDADTEVNVGFEDAGARERFMLGDVTGLDGEPWAYCTRSILKAALERLDRAAGVRLLSTFEHEFQLRTDAPSGGEAYSLSGFSRNRRFGETLVGAIGAAGLQADTFMKEFGADQFEVTVAPEIGLRAADAAVILREITYATGRHIGSDVTFTPIRDPRGVGNGVHIHMSFLDGDGAPAGYDPAGPGGMSAITGSFAAGILRYLDSFIALTAPSAISYLRLTPHRWSAAFNNLGLRDREASLRICPVAKADPAGVARQFNIEFRAADAAASPHMALAAIVHAGAQGIEDGLAAPPITEEDLSVLDGAALRERGLVRLPQSLEQALENFAANETVRQWFGQEFCEVYLAHKRHELAHLADLTVEERCAAYTALY